MSGPIHNEGFEDIKRSIGWSIRSLRNKRGLTLEDVSKKAGISIPLLSQFERGDANINIANLWKISQALDVEVELFFQQEILRKEVEIIRAKDRRKVKPDHAIPDTGYSFEHLYSMPDIEVFVVEIDNITKQQVKFNSHPGIEFSFVLEGEVEFLLKDGRCATLQIGDAVRFSAEHQHAYRGIGGKARVLAFLHMHPEWEMEDTQYKKLTCSSKNAITNGNETRKIPTNGSGGGLEVQKDIKELVTR